MPDREYGCLGTSVNTPQYFKVVIIKNCGVQTDFIIIVFYLFVYVEPSPPEKPRTAAWKMIKTAWRWNGVFNLFKYMAISQ